ncbi:CGNR zinc finger domain-containing protein [Puerhibacterium sp. TATVAM-FAB25]|uniref:CGNR zinc finger domain-containing protein n=1 Tax=Puerhibacterium sp. TATVAM-FAB25 TaxID=3093699 RepID=UPI00397853DD
MSTEPSPRVLRVRDFVNTAEPQLGTDQLVAGEAAEVLQRLGLVATGKDVDTDDLALLVGVREGLRCVLLGHAGHAEDDPRPDSPPPPDLDTLLRTVPLTARLGDGPVALRAVHDRPAHHAVAAVLGDVVAAPPDEWARLKVCARDTCRWAFYDASRNRSGRWCSMAGCGNIVKMRRAHRARAEGSSADARD